jgi:pyocin large subunit-like protein
MSAGDYVNYAQRLLNTAVGGDIDGFIDKSGEVWRHNKATNDFAKARKNGIIKTLYKPTSKTYWQRMKGEHGEL